MTDLTRTSFHDATVGSLRREGSDIYLDISDILAAEEQYAARVILRGVSRIVRNGKETSDVGMEEEDGEIIDFEAEDSMVKLIIQWNNFKSKTRLVCAYEFFAAAIDVNATKIPSTR